MSSNSAGRRTSHSRAEDYDPAPGHSVFDDDDTDSFHLADGEPAPVDTRSFSVPAPEATAAYPPADPYPEQQPHHPGPPPRRRKKRRPLRWLLLIILLALLAVLAEGLILSRSFSAIDRVDTEDALAPPSAAGENFLIVGSDSRENVDPDDPDAGAVGTVGGERTDTIVLLRVEADRNLMLPLPRDLWVPIAGTGGEQRINTAIQGGPDRLIETIETSLGIPVHHYLEVDFSGFKGLVDALGGIDIDFEHAAFDTKSGLDVPTPGVHTLDGVQALAFVRSRAYTERIEGSTKVDGTGDLGRIERQQQFLRATFSKATEVRDPLAINRIANAVKDDVRIDDTMSFTDAINFGRKLAAASPETVELPVANATRGSAAVLVFAEGSEAALNRFR